MAKATKRYEDKETIVVEKVLTGVTLELTMDEAEALMTLTGRVLCGSPAERVFDCLQDISVKHGLYDIEINKDGNIRLTRKLA